MYLTFVGFILLDCEINKEFKSSLILSMVKLSLEGYIYHCTACSMKPKGECQGDVLLKWFNTE